MTGGMEEQSLAPCSFGSDFQGRASGDLAIRLEWGGEGSSPDLSAGSLEFQRPRAPLLEA